MIRDLLYGGIEHAVWRFVFTGVDLDAATVAEQLADALLSGIVERSAEDSNAAEATVVRLERAVARLESQIEG